MGLLLSESVRRDLIPGAKEARVLLRRFGYLKEDEVLLPVSPWVVARDYGVGIFGQQAYYEVRTALIRTGGNSHIAFRQSDSREDREFNIARMLCLAYMIDVGEVEQDESTTYLDIDPLVEKQIVGGPRIPVDEAILTEFALELLMPTEALAKFIGDGEPKQIIGSAFGVSQKLLDLRLVNFIGNL